MSGRACGATGACDIAGRACDVVCVGVWLSADGRDKRVHDAIDMDQLSAYAFNCGGGGWWCWLHKREHSYGSSKRAAVSAIVYGSAGRWYRGVERIGIGKDGGKGGRRREWRDGGRGKGDWSHTCHMLSEFNAHLRTASERPSHPEAAQKVDKIQVNNVYTIFKASELLRCRLWYLYSVFTWFMGQFSPST